MRRLATLTLALALAVPAAARSSEPARRAAVIVGADRAPSGRAPLRFAHDDADRVARVLEEVGGFRPGDVAVLMDPAPGAVLHALARARDRLAAAPGETLLVFYYSGHADDRALYPGGRALPLSELRAALEGAATVRIGILDACRGGAWTRAKGLHPDAPFEVQLPLDLSSEGSVLIASSSGVENAHETDALDGSFFTHHFVAGLRGAADRSGEGEVSITEAFEYARERTVRDTLLLTGAPQHPSFDLELRGRNDVVLTRLDAAAGNVTVDQAGLGALSLVHADTGLVLLELPPREGAVRVAVPPGRYLLVRRRGEETFARELTVRAGETQRVEEESLELVAQPGLAVKAVSPPRPLGLRTTVAARSVELELNAGTEWFRSQHGSLVPGGMETFSVPRLVLGLTDRLQLHVLTPAFAYRFGERGGVETLPWAGMLGWGFEGDSFGDTSLTYQLGVGLDERIWLGRNAAVNVSLRLLGYGGSLGAHGTTTYGASHALSLGGTAALGPRLTLSGGLGIELEDPVGMYGVLSIVPLQSSVEWVLGSVQEIAMRAQPLVTFQATDHLALEGFAALRFDHDWDVIQARAALGASYTF